MRSPWLSTVIQGCVQDQIQVERTLSLEASRYDLEHCPDICLGDLVVLSNITDTCKLVSRRVNLRVEQISKIFMSDPSCICLTLVTSRSTESELGDQINLAQITFTFDEEFIIMYMYFFFKLTIRTGGI